MRDENVKHEIQFSFMFSRGAREGIPCIATVRGVTGSTGAAKPLPRLVTLHTF